MKTLHLLIIAILVASSIIVSQSVFAQQTSEEILQERDNAKKTELAYNGTMLIVTQEIDKTEYKAGEKFSFTPHLVNVGNNVATITHGEPLFEIEILDQNGNISFIWGNTIATIGITETLEPGMSTTGRWVSGYGGFPEIVLDRLGNYTIYSVASINSEGIPAHTESIWSKPLEITILPANYTSRMNSTNSIPPIPYSILRSASPTLTPSETQSLVNVALAIPELQKWSHDWHYVDMGFLGNNKLATVGFEWQYAIINLKAPSSSALIPCDNDWWAWVDVDMTTMKVVQATYPTMESHNCQIAIGGGTELSSYHHVTDSPLKQVKSGIAANNVVCTNGLTLVIKAEDGSPACVKPTTAQKLAERGWAKEIVTNTLSESTTLNQTRNELEIELANQTYEAGYPVGVNLKNVNQDYGCKIPSITVRDVSNQSLVFGPTPERDYGHSHCADPWHVTFYAGLEKNALVTKPTRFEILATLDNVTYQKEFTAVPSNYSGTDITSESNQILPGFLTYSTCLPIPDAPPNNGTLVKYTGFAVYHRYLAEQVGVGMEIDDYLLNPGQTGSFVMQVHQGQFPSGYNLAGGLDFQSQNLLNVDNDTTWKLNRPTASEAHPGLVVSYTPGIAHVGPQGYATFTVSITALQNATQGSYWLHLPPGRCGGHLVLLTVGDKPLTQPPDYIGNDFDSNFVNSEQQVMFELINPGIHTFENCSLNYVSNNQTTTIKTFTVIPPGMEYKYNANVTSTQIDKRFLQCTTPPITKIYPNEVIDGLPW